MTALLSIPPLLGTEALGKAEKGLRGHPSIPWCVTELLHDSGSLGPGPAWAGWWSNQNNDLPRDTPVLIPQPVTMFPYKAKGVL